MKHDSKLAEKEHCRVDVTFVGAPDENGSCKVRRTDDVYLSFEEGELLLKKLNSGLALK